MPLNEGQTVQYTVTTTNTADGTVLYWKTTGNTTNSDIVGGNTGSITITNNRAYINVTMAADESPDGSKTLGIALLTGSLSGTTVAATNPDVPIAINDTSNTAPPPTTFTLYTWGGLTGDNTAVERSSPVQIGASATWALASKINTKSNGTLWTWAGNGSGQLGLNDRNNRSSPTQVGSSTDWYPYFGQQSLAQGNGYSNVETTLFVKNNGTLWTWGDNRNGVLGLGDGVYRSSPTQVGTGTNWSKVSVGMTLSTRSTAATKTDGTLWTWGRNNYGQLGQNNTIDTASPIQVGNNTNWLRVITAGHTMAAIKTDGTLWTWGSNAYGGLGLNDGSGGLYKSSPTQVGSLTTWTSIATSGSGFIGISNGRLYYWGGWLYVFNNGWNYKSSPTQIGADTDWSKVSNGNPFTLLKTNGTLWSMGNNQYGGLGLNNRTAYYNTIKQIGTKNTWVEIGTQAAISSE